MISTTAHHAGQVHANRPRRAILLPGSGSDEVFVQRVFAAPLNEIGIDLHTPPPGHGADAVAALSRALDNTVGAERPVLGGISLGAHVAAGWARAHPARCAGLLLAMPGWLGEPGDAPAAVAARVAADRVERYGVDGALAVATRGVPGWLADELHRAWSRQGDGLAAALRAAASHPAPTERSLTGITVPSGVACCVDDPVHPVETARRYAEALPVSVLATTTLATMGENPAALGAAVVGAWRRAVP